MKRFYALVLSLLLLWALTACGGAEPAETTLPPEDGSVVAVSTVDELLAAIAPGAQILLQPGEYNLSQASDYGRISGSVYYSWEDTYDGFELQLRGVRDLTIRGSGVEETTLTAQPRYADVLELRNCAGVVLEDMTLGHSLAPGECAGGVVAVQGCLDITLQRLGLYGCGVHGLYAEDCTNVRLADSAVYDCSNGGVVAYHVDGLTVESCKFYDLGYLEYGGYAAFELTGSTRISITGCEITGNTLHYLIAGDTEGSIRFSGNTVARNQVVEMAFHVYSGSLVMEDNTFEDNTIYAWYPVGYSGAVDYDGNPASLPGQVPTEEPAELRVVSVSTADEFLAAIGPNTQILLEAPLYDLSTARGYGETGGEYYYWQEDFDGYGLVIAGVDNLSIIGAEGDREAHTIAAVPRYANVLNFNGCRNLFLSGFTAGHTEEPGYCTGGVLFFKNCSGMLVDNCGLYGCGILGVQAENSENLQLLGCDIYECSYGGVQLYRVNGVALEGCVFRDLGGPELYLDSCTNVTVDGSAIDGEYYIA